MSGATLYPVFYLHSRCEKTLVQAGHMLPKMWEVTITWPVGGVVKADILHIFYPAKQCIVFQHGCSTKTLEDPGAAVLKKQIIPFRPRFRHNVSIKMAKNTQKKCIKHITWKIVVVAILRIDTIFLSKLTARSLPLLNKSMAIHFRS